MNDVCVIARCTDPFLSLIHYLLLFFLNILRPVNTGLLQRFPVEHYPCIFHVYNGETRQFTGTKSYESLVKFAQGGWQSVPPLPSWRSPTSRIGRVLGYVINVPTRGYETYHYMKTDKGYTDLSLASGVEELLISFLQFQNAWRISL